MSTTHQYAFNFLLPPGSKHRVVYPFYQVKPGAKTGLNSHFTQALGLCLSWKTLLHKILLWPLCHAYNQRKRGTPVFSELDTVWEGGLLMGPKVLLDGFLNIQTSSFGFSLCLLMFWDHSGEMRTLLPKASSYSLPWPHPYPGQAYRFLLRSRWKKGGKTLDDPEISAVPPV